MLRIGSFLVNPRQVSMVELQGAEVRTHMSNYSLTRRFNTQAEAQHFFNNFQEEFSRLIKQN